MKETYERLKKKGYTDEKFDKWLKNPNTKKIYDELHLEEIKELWYGKETKKDDLLDKVSDMTKDELDEYSINTYGVDLDKRFKKETMVEELIDAIDYYNEDENQ